MCPKCGIRLKLVGQGYCRECRNEQAKKYRKPLTGAARMKMLARSKTNTYIKRGLIVRGPCEVCGNLENIQAHHDDYERWKEVRWLCPFHHRQHHRVKNS